MAHLTPPPQQPPARWSRSPWFWLLSIFVPIVIFFAALGVAGSLERWHIQLWWIPWQADEQAEAFGKERWLPEERRADMERRVRVIDRAIPAIEGEMKFLDDELKKAQAKNHNDPTMADLVASLRRQREFLVDRLDELRSDRAYYVRELHEK